MAISSALLLSEVTFDKKKPKRFALLSVIQSDSRICVVWLFVFLNFFIFLAVWRPGLLTDYLSNFRVFSFTVTCLEAHPDLNFSSINSLNGYL